MKSLPAIHEHWKYYSVTATLTVVDGDGTVKIGEEDQLGLSLHVRKRRCHRESIWTRGYESIE